MRVFVNGREIDVPTSNGRINASRLREAASIPPNRPMILKGKDGANKFINPNQDVTLSPHDHFADISNHERG